MVLIHGISPSASATPAQHTPRVNSRCVALSLPVMRMSPPLCVRVRGGRHQHHNDYPPPSSHHSDARLPVTLMRMSPLPPFLLQGVFVSEEAGINNMAGVITTGVLDSMENWKADSTDIGV